MNIKKKRRERERERERAVRELTRVRSLFKLRNTSCFLIDLRSVMSSSSNKVYSTASITYPALPC